MDLPELTPEHFEILAVRELRKVGLEVSELRIHRRSTFPEPERGYLLELAGLVSRGPWRGRVLIACRRQEAPIGRAEVESLRDHLKEAGVEAALLFATAAFDRAALTAAADGAVALLRVTDGRTAFDTRGWGTPGHYPAWLPAYCAQAVGRDSLDEPRYQLLESGQGEVLLEQLRRGTDVGPTRRVDASEAPRDLGERGGV